ncbi:MAG TPA: hypothetical protein VK625_00050, partial [Flavitalea sp.]|nr:hypothetical protein [Flavitalea sp.]
MKRYNFAPILGLMLISVISNAQSNVFIEVDSAMNREGRFNTKLFVLNTCDPSYIVFKKNSSQGSLNTDFRNGKLLVKSNQMTSFKIEAINPLRFKYYINSEAITQFVEPENKSAQLGNILKDGIFMSPYDITVPQIFKEDIEKNNQRILLTQHEIKINAVKDSLSKYRNEYRVEVWNNPFPMVKYNEKQEPVPFTDDENKEFAKVEVKLKPSRLNLQKWDDKLNDLLKEYEKQIMTLPINSNELSILRVYKNKTEDYFFADSSIKSIENDIKTFASKYDDLNEDFKKVDSLFFLSRYRHYGRYGELDSMLSSILRNYGYANSNLIGSDNSYTISVDLKEFLIKKRYQVFEEFVLDIATKIGILLQSNFREISQLTNSLKFQTCLLDSQIELISDKKKEVSLVFDFVQKTSAEFQILVNYLDIDNKIYSNIAKSINTNYYLLLNYIKNLDFLEKNNTIEFTLPLSTNLRNMDLVRYQVDREDKLTGGKQSYVYDIWLKGGFKVDFSFGIFASGLIDNEYQKYQSEISPDSVQINRQRSGNYNFGFGGMVNIT